MRHVFIAIISFILLTGHGLYAADEGVLVPVSGRVTDANNAAVSGARVAAKRLGTDISAETTTNADGEFTLTVVRGEYSLTVSAPGFATHKTNVDVAKEQKIDISLAVESASASVTISDDAVYTAEDTRSATRTFTPLRDIPQSLTVIKAEQIREQSMTTVADVVKYVPGVTSHQGENNRDDVIIRGNRSSADFFRDGVRDDVQYYRDLYNTERFEALKGPNAMIFGRGGGGGVINRVTKEAGSTVRAFSLAGGSYGNARFTGDLGQELSKKAAFRLNGVFERSGSFRRFVDFKRGGINPTFAFTPDSKTSIRVGYEFFRDRRTADRGMTSFQGRPVELPISTFYGDPKNSRVRSDVNLLTGSIERLFGSLIFRNRASYGVFDRFYQNYVPGTANATATLVTLTAYNTAIQRKNFFDQTDLTYQFNSGPVRHTIVGGTEFGRQATSNFRQTGFFNNTSTSFQVPFADPVTSSPITFRQSATDANNHLRLNLAAGFIQDQIELTRYLQVIAGVRYDYFDLTYFNDRNGDVLNRKDKLLSPRLGLVIKPTGTLSVYGSYSVSYLPSSGDQFASLTTVTQQVKPEKFENLEAGVKWDIRRGLSLTTAVYRLDRTNTRSVDPNDLTRIVQTGSQRTTGMELGLAGSVTDKWQMSGGYATQNARITSTTAAAQAGQQVAQVPRNTFSLWNKYAFAPRISAGLGLVARSRMFAAIDNTVVLPGYLRADAAVFFTISEHWRVQANLENLTNKRYFVNADSNTNISPGAPRSLKISLNARF